MRARRVRIGVADQVNQENSGHRGRPAIGLRSVMAGFQPYRRLRASSMNTSSECGFCSASRLTALSASTPARIS